MADIRLNLKRFEREVQSTAQLTHWNTIEIFDYGNTEDGVFYYVMEYLPGMNLDEVVRMNDSRKSSGLSIETSLRGAAEAHGQGLIHRDIKPANIFARRGGMYDVAKLLDFTYWFDKQGWTPVPMGRMTILLAMDRSRVRRCTCHLSRRSAKSRTNAAISIHWAEWPTI